MSTLFDSGVAWRLTPADARRQSYFALLVSDDSEVLDIAARIFASTRCETSHHPHENGDVWRWNVRRETTEAGERWTACGDDGSQFSAVSRGAIVTQIEYAALHRLSLRLNDDAKNHAKAHTDGNAADVFFGVHGALLERDGQAIVIVGPKEAGKSTLSVALWRAGWQLRCDDFALLCPSIKSDSIPQSCPQAWPAPRRVSLRAGSRALLGDALWSRIETSPSAQATSAGVLFHPHEVEFDSTSGPVESSEGTLDLSAVFFLGRRGAPVETSPVTPLAPFVAALALLPYSTLLDRSLWLAADATYAPTLTGSSNAAPAVPDAVADSPTNAAPVGDWGAALPMLSALFDGVRAFDLRRDALAHMIAGVDSVVFPAS